MTKQQLHPRNRHNSDYDFDNLCQIHKPLSEFVHLNQYHNKSIDFANPSAVKHLNIALLRQDYRIDFWDIPDNYLCPPIPGRVDYIHYLADLLTQTNNGKPPPGRNISVLDIGTGASCIYPILGQRVYRWNFVASDIDPISIKAANQIIVANKGLKSTIDCRLQKNAKAIFNGIIQPNEYFDLTMANPPFHQSQAEATKGSQRKWRNLGKQVSAQDLLNFGGQKAELWCPGGELSFIRNIIKESHDYRFQVLWFSSLVSKKANIAPLQQSLREINAQQVKVVTMSQGNKISHFIAWSLLTDKQQHDWCKARY